MFKKVPVERLRVGMFVHDINCGWLDHPFLLNQVAIDSEQTLQRLLRTGTREVHIDTARGLDVEQDDAREEVGTGERLEQELLAELHRASNAAPSPRSHVPLREEMVFARATANEARRVVSSVMHSVRAGRQFEMADVEDVVEQMAASLLRNPHALLGLTRIRELDHYTFEHSISVAVFLLAFARGLGLEEKVVRDLGIGGLLHDVGKTRIPLDILTKPARLTEAEFALMREHVRLGCDILNDHAGLNSIAMAVVREHHERQDRQGYPRGLRGDALSLFGQMAAVVDVYDANTADRVYHQGEVPTRVLGRLLEWSAHLNSRLVQHFIRSVGIWPVGSLVRLANGWIAVVVEQGPNDLLHPRVRVIYDSRSQQLLPPRDWDLSDPEQEAGFSIVGAVAEKVCGLRAADFL